MPIHRECALCQKPFSVPPAHSRGGDGQYCSRKCSAVHRAAKRPDPLTTFWNRVDRAGEDCWEWQGPRNENGYGRMGTGGAGKYLYAHRVAYTLAKGPIPKGFSVLHACDNPPCCRPDHLSVGDQRANNAERDGRNRVRHGDRHANAKLTAADVERARTLYATGAISQRALGRLLGVSHGTIRDALNGTTWKR